MPRLVLDKPLTIGAPTPAAGAANNLFTFLAQRYQASYNMLNCPQLLNISNPVTTTTDSNGVVISATYNLKAIGQPDPPVSAPNCKVNERVINGCTGVVTINGQPCALSFANNTVTLNCPTKP